jgi:nucleotide-binding universal stress UspA family protein
MKIVVPLKTLTFGMPLAKTSINIAKKIGAEITFLHVVDTRPHPRAMYRTIPSAMVTSLKEQGRRTLDEVVNLANLAGIKAGSKLVEGSPAEEILNAVSEADLLVIRPRVFSPERRFGDITEEIIKRTVKPVMVLEREHAKFEKCLVPFDGSKEAKTALKFLVEYGDRMTLDEINIVYVAKTLKETKRGVHLLREAEEITRGLKTKVETQLITAEEKKEIPARLKNYCTQNRIDFIVMGRTGKGAIKRFFLGSVSRALLGMMTIPIILVPFVPD